MIDCTLVAVCISTIHTLLTRDKSVYDMQFIQNSKYCTHYISTQVNYTGLNHKFFFFIRKFLFLASKLMNALKWREDGPFLTNELQMYIMPL